jgi:hypothetical protein
VGCQRGSSRRVARARRLHISDYRLPAIIDVDVLDADILVSAVTEAAKGLDLHGIGPHQPSRGRCERRYSVDRFDLRHRRSSSVAIGKASYSMRLRSRVLARDARSATGNFAALSDFGAEARVLK